MFFTANVMFGSLYSVTIKLQNTTVGANGAYFHHPFFQSFLNSFSGLLAYATYLIRQRWRRNIQMKNAEEEEQITLADS